MISFIYTIDFIILDYIDSMLHTPFLDYLMPIITRLGNKGVLWIIISIIFLTTKKYRSTGITMLVALGISTVIGNEILKPLIGRERPYVYGGNYQLLIPFPHDFSFPSGHTMSSFTAATVIFLHHRKLGIMAFFLAALIGFSRLYLYVHFPSDILAGMLIGIFVAFLSSNVYRCFNEKIMS